jgi:FlaA1/EpsC-like NDP-sugar epimerase
MSGKRTARSKPPDIRSALPGTALAHVGATKGLGDSLAWVGGIWLAAAVRWDLLSAAFKVRLPRMLLLMALAIVVQMGVGALVGLYRNHWRFGSFEEVAVVVETVAATLGLLLCASWILGHHGLPVLVSLGAATAAACGMVGIRYVWRLFEQLRLRPGSGSRPVLIYGAGEGAEQLIHNLRRNPHSAYVPVAALDDDPGKANLRIKGVRVIGDRTEIARAAKLYGADLLVLAIPSASSGLIRSISSIARSAGLEVRVLPPTRELLDGHVSASDIRSPTIADLLGRHPVQIDLESAAAYLRNRRVLVTGAGGSIGSELCRQLARFGLEALIMVDRDESALHAVQLSLDGRGMLDSHDLVLLDIRERDAVHHLLLQRRPHVVFHAAALKHLALLELHPAEAVKSNVWGTRDLLDAAMAASVERFVNISTDKAADPISTLGLSKRIAERLTAHAARSTATGRYLSVRFGNVLGSRGSVLPAFQAQIERGGPVFVTHPEVSRYFMTIKEAVQLVIQAGAIAPAGSVMVLEMGDPVRIADVAKRMIAESGRDIEVVYTGLRPGEKLSEDLFSADEDAQPAAHPLLSKVDVPGLAPETVAGLPITGDPLVIRAALERVCALVPGAVGVCPLIDLTAGGPLVDDAPAAV